MRDYLGAILAFGGMDIRLVIVVVGCLPFMRTVMSPTAFLG